MKAVVTRPGSSSKRRPGSAPPKQEIQEPAPIRLALAKFCLSKSSRAIGRSRRRSPPYPPPTILQPPPAAHCNPSREHALSVSNRKPPARSGLRRLLSSDGATVAILAVAITAATGLAGTAVAGDTALSARIDQTHDRINKTHAGIDALRAHMNARIDNTNARIDRLLSLLQSLRQEHRRQLDAIKRQQADRPPSPDNRVTP